MATFKGCLGRHFAGNRTPMTEDPGTNRETTDSDADTDTDTDETLHMTSGADVLRRAEERGQTETAAEPEGAQEPPD
jgi:hypothetical protein